MWRTVESNHADPALLITNPNVCRLPCAVFPAVPLPCRWRTSEWACEKRNKKIVLMRRLRHSATFALAGYYLTISQSPANISEIDGTQLSARPVSSL